MKKISLIIIIALIIIVSIFLVINFNNKQNIIEIDIEELGKKISESGVFQDEIAKVDKEIVYKAYGFNDNLIKEIVSYQGSGATSEEILILQVNEKENLNEVKEMINNRIEERKEIFVSYLPKEVYKLENNIFRVYNNYIIMCISNDNEKVNEIINQII
jgi:uncharacterized protein YxeA